MTTNNIAPRPVRAGDKVARDSATAGEGKVYLGDAAPVTLRPVRTGRRVTGAASPR